MTITATAPATAQSEATSAPVHKTDVRLIRSQVVEQLAKARAEHRTVDRAIKKAEASGIPRPGHRNKLTLSIDELSRYMDQRDARARLHQKLLVLVPVERVLRIGLQQDHAFEPSSPTMKPLIALLHRRAVHRMPAAFEEINWLFTRHPELFGPLPANMVRIALTPMAIRAQALHAKLLACGLLSSEELITLRNVFAKFTG